MYLKIKSEFIFLEALCPETLIMSKVRSYVGVRGAFCFVLVQVAVFGKFSASYRTIIYFIVLRQIIAT